ncbi:MAG TPA: hypothetical protein VGA37_03255 [Gemmatimonadales bacterium]
MKRLAVWALLGAVQACGARDEPADASAAAIDTMPATEDDLSVDTTPPEMPDFPVPEDNVFAARAAGVADFGLSWHPTAGRCSDSTRLLVMADTRESGMSLLLALPGSGGDGGTFVVDSADTASFAAGRARLGVQLFEDQRALAYRAVAGTVRVHDAGTRLSGRFAATFQAPGSNGIALVAGAFSRLVLEPLAPGACLLAGEVDTTGLERDSTGG